MAASATEIARAMAAGATLATDALDEHEGRHRATTAAINALVQPRHDGAREEAAALDARRRDAGWGGPLAGVPMSVKECFGVAGLVTSLGIPRRRSALDPEDAPLVARLRSAGAVIVGKSNVSQAMYLHDSDNPVWGRTNNPRDVTRGPGGSSGGDAALVAAEVVPLAVGNDLAGSIRQPAHACGIVGFLPRSSVLGDGGGFDTMPQLRMVRPRAGFLARHVDDAALAFAACVDAAAIPAALPHPLRVGWWDDAGPIEPSLAVRRAVHETADRLSCAGVAVTRISGALAEDAVWLHLAILSADGGANVRRLFGGTPPIAQVARLLRLARVPRWLRPLVSAVAELGGRGIEAKAVRMTGPRGAACEAFTVERSMLARRCAGLAEQFDALVCPVSALPALRHGTAARLLLAAAPCLLANLLDLPAGTVPTTRVRPEEERGRGASWDPVIRAANETDRGSRGLPVGVQVIGLPGPTAVDPIGSERVVLEVMRLAAGAGG